MSEDTNLTYHQRNRETKLHKAKIIIKIIMEEQGNRQERNIEIYLKKKKI